MGGNQFDRGEGRLHGGDAAEVGAPLYLTSSFTFENAEEMRAAIHTLPSIGTSTFTSNDLHVGTGTPSVYVEIAAEYGVPSYLTRTYFWRFRGTGSPP